MLPTLSHGTQSWSQKAYHIHQLSNNGSRKGYYLSEPRYLSEHKIKTRSHIKKESR